MIYAIKKDDVLHLRGCKTVLLVLGSQKYGFYQVLVLALDKPHPLFSEAGAAYPVSRYSFPHGTHRQGDPGCLSTKGGRKRKGGLPKGSY